MVETGFHRSGSSLQSFTGRNRSSGAAQFVPYELQFLSKYDQWTSSNGRNWAEKRAPDIGGPWFLNRTTHEVNPMVLKHLRIEGPAVANVPSTWDYIPSSVQSESAVKALGTKAISQAAPNNPSFSIPQLFGELKKDGLPSPSGAELWREKSNFLKGSGSEFLNLEFGWKPLVSEVRNFANTVTNSNKIMDGYIKGSGSPVRRRLSFPPSYSQKQLGGTRFIRPSSGSLLCDGHTFETEESQSWFSGSFQYYVPIGDDQATQLRTHYAYAKKLLGVRLTPDTLWELAPWSWAADWFGNTGDIMANISNLGSDGMVMRYGYMMSYSKKSVTNSFSFQGASGHHRETYETKRRVPSQPYGFQTAFDGLSTRQAAICAALGLTRLR